MKKRAHRKKALLPFMLVLLCLPGGCNGQEKAHIDIQRSAEEADEMSGAESGDGEERVKNKVDFRAHFPRGS